MYKVVRKNDGRYYSAGTSSKGFMLEYIPNEWVEAKVGGLLVFDGVEYAKEFMKHVPGYEVWRCEVSEEVELPEWRLETTYMELNQHCVALLWNGEFGSEWEHYRWPNGTRAFKRVKLVERVAWR